MGLGELIYTDGPCCQILNKFRSNAPANWHTERAMTDLSQCFISRQPGYLA